MTRLLLLRLTLAALLLTGCHGGKPSAEAAFAPVPGNVLPSPNAFDYYAKAGAALRDADKITAALDPRHPTLPAAQEHLVRENAAALALVRKGFAFPYMNPAQRSETETWPYYAHDRKLCRLLRLQGQKKAVHAEWGGAVSSDLDAVRLGTDVPRGGTLIGMLVGVACQSIGRRDVWDSMPYLHAVQAKAAARRLESIAARRVPYADVMRQEEYFGQAAMQALFRNVNWRKEEAAHLAASQGNVNGIMRGYIWGRLTLTKEREVYDNYTHFMDELVADGRKPYVAKPGLPPLPTDIVNSIFLPVLGGGRLKDANNQVQNALLITALALHAYQAEHGRLPDTLAALVPAYLEKVPDDPFALSRPLRYTRTGKTYTLYSVGPDGKDDKGKAIIDTTKPAPAVRGEMDRRRWVLDQSTGDIVAGVNRS